MPHRKGCADPVIPSPWQFVLLALAVYRLWRLAAIDDIPPLPHWRNRAVGATQTAAGNWEFDRPTLAHLLQCAWCLGFHLSWSAWVLFWWQPHWTLVAATPFALSTVVGLAAANLKTA